jgi:Zn-dependent peptidase ImmA (M78 family)/transcriptional regulator with XRE-family HTH domain
MTDRPNPDLLTAARESRRRSQTEIADAVGVTQGLISKAEHGLVDLSVEQVNKLAAFLDYPVALFYEPGRARIAGSACLYHRKRKTLPAKILTSLNAEMELRRVSVRRLLKGIDIAAQRMFHTMDPDEYGGSPQAVAQAMRAAWRVPSGPIENMTALIESAGGIILSSDFGTNKLMGMSCWESDSPPIFYLNERMATADLRWTLAHELGHIVMHAVPPAGDPEVEADAFAAEFLAPAALVTPDLRRLTFDRLPALKMVWKLSMKGLIVRADRLGTIDRAQATRMYKQYSARGYNDAEPYPLPAELPTIVRSAVDVHQRVHGYSAEEISEGVFYLHAEEFSDRIAPLIDHTNVVSLFSSTAAPPSRSGSFGDR